MRFYGQAEQTGQMLLKAFEEGRVPAAMAPIFIKHDTNVRYSARWSWLNQLVVALHGYSDARSYKGWQEIGRQVRKGEKAFHILEPMRITKVDEETGSEYSILVGFKSGARFGLEQTEGEPLPQQVAQENFLSTLPLIKVAQSWGIRVSTYNGQATEARGVFSVYGNGSESIALGVENLSTWTHELIHAADYKLGNLKEKGQHWASETVAELGGCILLHLVGKSDHADDGGAWAYIQRYAAANEIEPISACIKMLDRTCLAVSLILDAAATA